MVVQTLFTRCFVVLIDDDRSALETYFSSSQILSNFIEAVNKLCEFWVTLESIRRAVVSNAHCHKSDDSTNWFRFLVKIFSESKLLD